MKNFWKKNLRKCEVPQYPIPFKIFADHATIFNSSPMQHVRWSSLWQKLYNCCYIELIVLNVTGFLDPTLKFINLDQDNIPVFHLTVFHLTLTCPKSAKKYTRTMCHRQKSLPESCRLELCTFIKRDFGVFL